MGWIVIKFEGLLPAKRVEWFEEKCEAQDEAERLNATAPKGVWYGWEASK